LIESLTRFAAEHSISVKEAIQTVAFNLGPEVNNAIKDVAVAAEQNGINDVLRHILAL